MKTTSQTWLDLIANIIENGDLVLPRGQATLEIMHVQSTINMLDPCVAVKARNLSTSFMAAEAAWILSGDNRVKTIIPYAPSMIQFSDDGMTFFGAYGPRIKGQLHNVVECLVNDRDSRQAVINLWRENPPQTKDVPCTVNVQWLVRDGVLHCIDTMRSSDVWLGWPYDVFNFSMLSAYIVICLRNRGVDVVLGTLTLQAGSQHLYQRNRIKAETCLMNPDCFSYTKPSLNEWTHPDALTEHLWNVANKCAPLASNFLSDLG